MGILDLPNNNIGDEVYTPAYAVDGVKGCYQKFNTIYCGNNLEILAKFPENSVDLIYADPPFFSGRKYEVIWGDNAEIRQFDDRFEGKIEHYVEWITLRLIQCHRVLKPTGSMYLHCDWHANAYLRIAMDKIFGVDNFRNEIVWCYKGGNANLIFRRKHDTIYFYSKTNKWTFNSNAIRIPYNKKLLDSSGTDENGKRFYSTGQNKDGKIYLNDNGQLPYDWWDDIPSASMSHGKEMYGYPTQKPEALLRRIIEASSNKNDIVLDPFCGCGTAIAVAHQLQRNWIGLDVSPTACRLMQKRLKERGKINAPIIGLPITIDELKGLEPFEFQNWVINKIGGTHQRKKTGDGGIDGWTLEVLNNLREPVQIKQSEDIGRNVVDNFETAIRRAGKTTGYIYAFSFGRGAHEETARARTQDNIGIKLIKISTLLEQDILRGFGSLSIKV